MGLQLDSKTFTLERRYMGLNILKNNDGTNVATVTIQTGTYDDGIWLPLKTDFLNIDNDTLTVLLMSKATQLGMSNPRLIEFMDKLVYGVMDGTIPTDTKLTVNTNVPAIVNVKRKGITRSSFVSGKLTELPVMLDVTIDVYAEGYKVVTQTFPALSGTKTLDITLEPLEPEPTQE